jgi:hypothetical protein
VESSAGTATAKRGSQSGSIFHPPSKPIVLEPSDGEEPDREEYDSAAAVHSGDESSPARSKNDVEPRPAGRSKTSKTSKTRTGSESHEDDGEDREFPAPHDENWDASLRFDIEASRARANADASSST